MNTVAVKNLADIWFPAGEATTQLNAPDWLIDTQEQALIDYQKNGLPTRKEEQWRYTDLRELKDTQLNFSTAAITELPKSASDNRLVFVNGQYQEGLSSVKKLADGIVFAPLSEALSEHGELLKGHLGRALPAHGHGFHQLNTALHSDGYVLIVAYNQVLQDPVEVIFMHTPGAVSHVRNVIFGAPHSQCSVIERHVTSGVSDAAYLNNAITEIFAEQNAHIDHTKWQSEADNAYHFGGVFVQQQRDSQVATHALALDGKLLRNDVIATLQGQGSHIEMNGLVLGADSMHVDNHTEVHHAVPHCTSDEFYKTILDDESRSVFRGRIVVAQDAQQTNADQQNNNLLLSERAEADTKPQLEIYADDVKCSHGATVGQLDQKSMFYLRSRGINPEQAQALLTFAFANEVVERIKVGSVKQDLIQRIAGELVSELEDVL